MTDAASTAPEPAGAVAVPRSAANRRVALFALGALATSYGVIGTAPLYVIDQSLAWSGSADVLGLLSLVFWSLVLVVSVKYATFVLRADNHGEGGILALAALIAGRDGSRAGRLGKPMLLALLGAGLWIGDSLMVPGISVLAAVEGIGTWRPELAGVAIPLSTVVVLIGVFVFQRSGPASIRFAFGPLMLLWFVTLAIVGLRGIAVHPAVLHAVDPRHAAGFLAANGVIGLGVLGFTFLAVAGAESMYENIGRVGKRATRLAWFAVVMPAVVLVYFGQGAIVLAGEPGALHDPFFVLVGGPLHMPMRVLATLAAAITAHSVIRGIFSITREAIQLGLWPRMSMIHTSARAAGQIYIPELNWLLMAVCIAIAIAFGSSASFAAGYGLATTGTMMTTTILFYLTCCWRRGWTAIYAIAFTLPFFAIELVFAGASTVKLVSGAFVPVAIGLFVFAVMSTWWRGRALLAQHLDAAAIAEDQFLADLEHGSPLRVRGTAVFMSPTPTGIPNVLLHHLKHDKILHQQVVLLSIAIENVPWIAGDHAVVVRELGKGFYRIIASFGFMQTPDVPALLARCARYGISAERMSTTYYLGRETVLPTGRSGLARWRKKLFVVLARNARSANAMFRLPPNRVVELGAQVEI